MDADEDVDDHVGDWEHTMTRFVNGEPQSVWFSQHTSGEAFTFAALEKDTTETSRPIVYSANGTHANFAIAGDHDHVSVQKTLRSKGTY
jgi:hypothetical protein